MLVNKAAVVSEWEYNVASDQDSGLVMRRGGGKPTHISITFAVALGMIGSIGQAGWFASSYSSRINALEKGDETRQAETKTFRIEYELDKVRRAAELEVLRQQQQVQNAKVAEALTGILVQLENLNANVGFLKQQSVNTPLRQTR